MTPTPTLLMLGAGTDQLPAYREARQRGYRLLAADARPDAPGAAMADEFLPISTRDTDGIAGALSGALNGGRLCGIVTTASDAALGTHHELAGRYGLAYQPPARAVRASMDKRYFRQVVGECGLPNYSWTAGDDPAALVRAGNELAPPLVVKPIDSSGGKGVGLVTDLDDLPAAIAAAQAVSPSRVVTVERYVTGRHYAVEIWMRGGEAHFVPITEKQMTPLPTMVTAGHLIPARLPTETTDRVREALVRICRALEITDGPANFDFIITDDGAIYVIEIGARLGGNAYPMLMNAAWGVDTVAATVSMSVGQTFDLTPTRSRVCLLHLLASPWDRPAVVRAVHGADGVTAHPGVLRFELFTEVGDRVLPFTQSAHKLGYVVLVAADHDELDALQDWFTATVRIESEPIDD